MNEERITGLSGYKLWRLTGSDLEEALLALESGEADGLSISRCHGFTDKNLDCLKYFNKLKVIAINDLEDADVSYLHQLSNLEFLSFSDLNPNAVVDLNYFQKLKHLRFAVSKKTKLPIQGLPLLEKLAIWSINDSNLSGFSEHSKLRSLELGRVIN